MVASLNGLAPQSCRFLRSASGRQATLSRMVNWLATLVKLSGEPGQLGGRDW